MGTPKSFFVCPTLSLLCTVVNNRRQIGKASQKHSSSHSQKKSFYWFWFPFIPSVSFWLKLFSHRFTCNCISFVTCSHYQYPHLNSLSLTLTLFSLFSICAFLIKLSIFLVPLASFTFNFIWVFLIPHVLAIKSLGFWCSPLLATLIFNHFSSISSGCLLFFVIVD